MRYIIFFLVVVVAFETLAIVAIAIRLRWALDTIVGHAGAIASTELWITTFKSIVERHTELLEGMNGEIKRLYALNSIAAIERATPDLFSVNPTRRTAARTAIESSLPLINDGLPAYHDTIRDAAYEAFKVVDEHFGDTPAEVAP